MYIRRFTYKKEDVDRSTGAERNVRTISARTSQSALKLEP